MKIQQVIFFILFALFLLKGGIFILKNKEKEIYDINFKNCKENLKTCQKDKENFFKNLNKKND
jgi:hypothetical protein